MRRRLMIRRGLATLMLGAMTLLPPAPALAQVTTGTILGTVRDASNAVVQDAEVVATNVGTQFTKKGVSDAEGRYALDLLPPGEYTLIVTAPNLPVAQRFRSDSRRRTPSIS
jgi:hypothetical protein